jgi:phosphatidyl-myo-inositol alpha-mannosyltransferase
LTSLKIAFVAPYDLSFPGGVNAHIRALAEALRALGHDTRTYGPASDPTVLASDEEAVGGAVAINVSGTVSGLGLNPMLTHRVGEVLRQGQYDVVHIHEPLTPVVPILFLRNARTVKVGTFHVHRESGHRIYAATSWLLRRWVKNLDYRIAVSEAARGTVARHFPGTYEIVPNGVDVDRFRDRADLRPAIEDDKRHILFVGRLEGRKGLPHLIEAMPRVVAATPDARLIVVGDGPDRADSERLAEGVAPNLVTFVGYVDDSNLPGYFHCAEVFCSPATGGESFGIVLLEAMAAGRAIVASQIDGYSGLIKPERTGVLVRPGDPQALASAITRVLNDDHLREGLGRRAATAATAFDWATIAGRTKEIYRRVIEEKSRRLP